MPTSFYTYYRLLTCGSLLGTMLGVAIAAAAQVPDTLQPVSVTGYSRQLPVAATVPVQQLDREQLHRLNSLSVADAVKYFSGVLVRDYGGIGGLKTVSVRSLGANHTGIMYDGLLLPEAQGGQIDLGKLSLDNIDQLSLYNSQPPDLLLPARVYSAASVLAIRSAGTIPPEGRPWQLRASLRTGSFGWLNPALTLRYRLNPRFYHSLSTEWQQARGHYPFRSYENDGSTLRRYNSDIKAFRAEYDAGYRITDSSRLQLKAYYYASDRGLPGAVILYNRINRERLTDRNFFIQASWQASLSARSHLLLSAKYNYAFNYYRNPDFQNMEGGLKNRYHQRESYASAVYAWKAFPFLSLSLGSDVFVTTLRRTDQLTAPYAQPRRHSWLSNLAVQARWSRLELQGNLLYTDLADKVSAGYAFGPLHVLTPALSAMVRPFDAPLRVRAFYKYIFRAPTFNDLYYTFIGNTRLRPEYARQYNLGFSWEQSSNGWLRYLQVTADGYYNRVTDKIVAVPQLNLFQWTMLNIGLTEIKGADIVLNGQLQPLGPVSIGARLSYTFQQALDMSDPASTLYKSQLPYTPIHSGSAGLRINYGQADLSLNFLFSGYRYRLGDPVPDNFIEGWGTQDLSLGYTLLTRREARYRLLLELNNLLNRQYEIIKYYPMPRFSYRVGITAHI